MDRKHHEIHSLLEETANLIRRSKTATRDAETPKSYKGKQIEILTTFANARKAWVNINTPPLIFLDKGGENEVYYDSCSSVYKLNNFEYAGDDLENFYKRIEIHNTLFCNVPYCLSGFAYNSEHEFCAVLIQPYVKAKREATEEEIKAHMTALGFEMDYPDEFHNDQYCIFDVAPNNVLYGIDGRLYFIDPQIRLRTS